MIISTSILLTTYFNAVHARWRCGVSWHPRK